MSGATRPLDAVTLADEADPQPASSSASIPAWQRLRVWGPVVVVCLPILWAAVRAAAGRWLPVGDDAYFTERSRDVLTSHHPLLGAWSSGSVDLETPINNLGPTQLDLLAPFTRFTPHGGTAVGVAAVNCAAIVETLLEAELFGIEDRTATGVRGRRGKFESAHEGTLFLDEVSDLSSAAQAKLLRTIQDLSVERVGGGVARRIDARIIVATNRPLCDLVERGRFRLDLYYRLNGIDVQVPPLRLGGLATPEGRAAGVALDRHLRSDGNKLNPGTTADLIAACLFVALRENKVVPSAPFRWDVPDWL